MRWFLRFVVLALLGAGVSAFAGNFTINGASTTAQTLAAGEAGLITANGSLTVSGSTAAVTITGANAALTNLGLISQTGTGRGLFDSAAIGLTITNGSVTNATALMRTADADVVRVNVGGVTLNNYGTLTSLNASAGGSQAVDFNPIVTGSNTINNFATGILQASEADAVRPGVNGIVNNDGLIKSTTTTGTSSDGIDAQTNTGITVVNGATAGSGLIEGARHGITGGKITGTGAYTMSITNNLGGTIKGNNGSGVNIDGINGNEVVTIINHGMITGNGVTGDGDGVDVDGLVDMTNTGIIRSVNAFSATVGAPAQSEGISVGGGTIVNSGTIEGLVASGNTNAVGRGISLLGNDITTGPNAGGREALYGNAIVMNQAGGLIRGDSDSGIAVDGPASGFKVTINNHAGATVRGGGTVNAAIRTALDNDAINNAGTIDGTSGGKAIDMGAGDNKLNITGGAASILGNVSGGVGGTNQLTIDPGSGNSFSYAGSFSNFNSAEVKSGTVTLSGASTYSGGTTVSGGKLTVTNTSGSATGTGPVVVATGGTLLGTGIVSVATTVDGILSPATTGTVGTITTGALTLSGTSTLAFDITNLLIKDLVALGNNGLTLNGGTLALVLSESGFDYTQTYHLVSGVSSLSGDGFGFVTGISSNFTPSFSFNIGGGFYDLSFTPVPEPSAVAVAMGLLGLIGFRERRKGAAARSVSRRVMA